MAFGRRQPPGPDLHPRPERRGWGQTTFLPLSVPSYLGAIALVGAAVFLLVSLRVTTPRVLNPEGVGDVETLNLALLKSVNSEARFRSCELRQKRPVLTFAKVKEGLAQPGSSPRQSPAEAVSVFLECVVQNELTSLCDPSIRRAFMRDATRAMQTYSGRLRAASYVSNQAFLDPKFRKFIDVMGSDAALKPLTTAQTDLQLAIERIRGAVILAASNGIDVRADLGWFSSGEVRSLLRNVQPVSAVCS